MFCGLIYLFLFISIYLCLNIGEKIGFNFAYFEKPVVLHIFTIFQ